MRLHSLEATAFGPFVETVHVDFDVLSDAGLFLLSGATGAGKSSVLDAVCFALYGAIPGDRRHAHRLRSDQAPPTLPPLVELEVSLAGRRFRIVRSPAWERPKKRGTGLTREPAKITVSERRDGAWQPVSSRLDEAGDLLSGLLGMNLDQFCQVALLPQGHFQAFLRADSAQRHQLLARLFRTGRFERVEAWLRDHRLELRRTSQTHLTAVNDLVSRLSEAAAEEIPDALADLSAPAAAAAADSWARLLSSRSDAHVEAAVRVAEASGEAARLATSAWDHGRERAEVQSRLTTAATARERLLAQAEAHQRSADKLAAGQRAATLRPVAALVDERVLRLAAVRETRDVAVAAASAVGVPVTGLRAEVDRLTDEISTLRVLLPAERHLTTLLAERARFASEQAAAQRDDELARAEATTLDEVRERVADELHVVAEALRKLPEVEAETGRLRVIAEARRGLPSLRAALALAVEDHATAVARRLDLRERLLDLRERRIAGMASELAGALAVGDDCPVCGSADHPRPAQPGEAHPAAEDERAAQRAVDDAQALEHALDLRVREATAALSAAEQVASAVPAEELEQLIAAAEDELTTAAAAAARHPALVGRQEETERRLADFREQGDVRRVRTAELTAAMGLLDDQILELTAQVDAARGEHPALSGAVEHAEARRRIAQQALDETAAHESARAAWEAAEAALTTAAADAGFDDVTAARAAEMPPEELTSLEALVRQYDVEWAAAERVLAEPGAQELLAAPAIDLATLELAHQQAVAAAQDAHTAREATQRTAGRVSGLVGHVQAALEAWDPVREQLELATSVSAFAEGRSPDNRLQMRLSAYVLSHRLSQVVAAANARLAGMSDQRYSLEHVGQRGAGETRGGLSLLVRDDWSGESRDPATLSGGETFVVSLALALGLADVVTHEAGGVDLATLFVDEGFGSLDAETLDDVLDILDTLRENGRAVGVVSHVAEMRDRIPTQLLVGKSRSGSTVSISS